MVLTDSPSPSFVVRVTDPDGRRWSIWRQPTPWRPRSPDLVASTVAEARNLPDCPTVSSLAVEVVQGLLVVAVASVLAVVELVALAVAWVPWWVAVHVGERPVRLELYRDGTWSRTRRAERDRVEVVRAEIAAAVRTGTLDPPRRPSGPRVRRSRT